MKRMAMVLLMLFLAHPCLAADQKQLLSEAYKCEGKIAGSGWTTLGVDDSDEIWMVDKKSIEGSTSTSISVWTSQRGEKRTSFAQFQLSCGSRQFAIMSGTEYDEDGKVLGLFEEKTPDWQNVKNGTLVELLWSTCCGGPDKR